VGPRAFEEVSGEKVNTVAFVLRREGDAGVGRAAVGTYFRLVKQPDSQAKQRRFERAAAHLRSRQPDPLVYRYRQADFDAIPGSPWVYWITPGLRKLFETLPKLSDNAELRAGMHGGDLFRFGRLWWEVGVGRIARSCKSLDEVFQSQRRWVPYMKGGSYRRWWGNQEWVFAFGRHDVEILSFSGNRLPSRQFYFRKGVTWNSMSSVGLSVRHMPEGFVFSDKSDSGFTDDPISILGLMNSSLFSYLINLVSPTIDFHAGYVGRIPVPCGGNTAINCSVRHAINLAKVDSEEDETTWDFIAPPAWPDGIEAVARRHAELAEIERAIDEQVYRLYGISDEDRAAIEAELAGGGLVCDQETEQAEDEPI